MAFKDCPTEETHLFQYTSLPLLPDYRDPFGTMLIARAVAGSLNIISADPKFSLYKNLVQVEW
jgi:PIN domain nuclease of toxin-antitoxin system